MRWFELVKSMEANRLPRRLHEVEMEGREIDGVKKSDEERVGCHSSYKGTSSLFVYWWVGRSKPMFVYRPMMSWRREVQWTSCQADTLRWKLRWMWTEGLI